MKRAHHLINLLVCPRTKSELLYVDLGESAGLLSKEDGVLYPIINNIVIMQPVAPRVKNMCVNFLEQNAAFLKKLGSKYDSKLTVEILCHTSNDRSAKWYQDEMEYWERSFKARFDSNKPRKPGWIRLIPRRKILKQLPENLSKKRILDLGCGPSSTLFDFYGKNLPDYIGLDLSFYALRLTQRMFPRGLFILASAESLPFRENSVDVVFAYGLFHHLPSHEENVVEIIPVIKPNGYLIGSDPLFESHISRQNLISRYNIFGNNRELFKKYPMRKMSANNEWINWKNLLCILKNKANVIEASYEVGPMGLILIKIFYDKMGIRTEYFTRFLIFLDQLWLVTIGKLHKALGAAGVNYAFRKY